VDFKLHYYFDSYAIIQTENKEHDHALEEVIFFEQGIKVLGIVSGRTVMCCEGLYLLSLYYSFLLCVELSGSLKLL